MIRVLVFDFNSVILDAETPIYRSWQETYREYGFDFSMQDWTSMFGIVRSLQDVKREELIEKTYIRRLGGVEFRTDLLNTTEPSEIDGDQFA